MPIVKGHVEIIRLADGKPVGRGFAYLHLGGRPSGSITQLAWDREPAEVGEALRLIFADGPTLDVTCTRSGATGCGPEIVRFRATEEDLP